MKTTTTGKRLDRHPASVRGAAAVAGLALVALAGCTAADSDEETTAAAFTTREVTDGTTSFVVVDNPGDGATLSYGADSGIELLTEEINGSDYAFKDMNANGTLDTWEDWRETPQVRAADLVPHLAIEQVQGLMLFSAHERSPQDGLTEDQSTYLSVDNLRNVLNDAASEVEPNVTWANEMEAYVETLASADNPYIPVNFSSDPRSDAASSESEQAGFAEAGTTVSQWPSGLGLAATFDPALVSEFAQTAAKEYRALGITMALSPQIDLATDPRWSRNSGTFGEDAQMTADMAKAYVDGFQGAADAGTRDHSVATTLKHFPGDGAGEGGRESHGDLGKFAVYPGGNQEEVISPFLAVPHASAVMMSYSVGVAADGSPAFDGELVASAYDLGKMKILREDTGYDGVVMTDWRVTKDIAERGGPWGVESVSVEERHYMLLESGIDMYGGNNDLAPVQAAYDMWQAAHEAGEKDIDADTRFRESGERIIRVMFGNGTYDNPFVDLENSKAVVGAADSVAAGIEAQLNSVVTLKNEDGAISASSAEDWSDKTVYVPQSYDFGLPDREGVSEYVQGPTLDLDLLGTYFGTVVTDEVALDAEGKVTGYTAPDLSDVDVVMVGMESPSNRGVGGNGQGQDVDTKEFIPISLQYRPYTADGAGVRKVSIAGDQLADGTQQNRSYFGKTSQITNGANLDAFERAAAAVEASGKEIPVVTVLKATNPIIPAEFEAGSDAIVVAWGVAEQALIEVALGLHESAGRLPIGFPKNMAAVEASFEDVPKDVDSYVDASGNTYEYGFGLDFSGPITD